MIINFASSSGIGALGFSLPDFLIQLGSFIIVFLVLRQYAFKPIIKILKERREIIEDGINLGETMKKKNLELEEKVDTELHQARQEADAILADAHKQSKEIILVAEKDAQNKAELISTQAKQRITQDTANARKKLKSELIGLVSDATQAIIGEKIDQKKDSALIDSALNKGPTK